MDNFLPIAQSHQPYFLLLVGLISLAVGSFLNVIIVRLPIIIEQANKIECYKYLSMPIPQTIPQPAFNLFTPRSHCPKCKQQLSLWENIPILSFILLAGKCRNCKQSISLRYPLTELLTTILSIIVAWRFGISLQSLAALILTWTLITLALIDLKHYFLPGNITFAILWLGLLISCLHLFQPPISCIVGAVVGYLSLWSVYWCFKLLTHKEGMGYGDFTLLAMLGAWLGWQQLPLIIILSSCLGGMVGTTLIILKNKTLSSAIPFGPFLAIAGWIALLWGQVINNWYLQHIGVY